MQLSPLQSRLVASLAASLCLLALYLLLFAPDVALAAELPLPADIFLDRSLDHVDYGDHDIDLQPSYEPDFPLFDRGIIGRAVPSPDNYLDNNQPKASNLNPGQTACYMIEKSTIFGDDTKSDARDLDIDDDGLSGGEDRPVRRQDNSKAVYISANTCLQPYSVDPKAITAMPPQLALYISFSKETGCPTPSKDYPKDQVVTFDEGAAMYRKDVTSDVYITVAAPNLTSEFGGDYNFRLAASIDDYFYSIDSSNEAELLWMDSDSDSALLVSRNLTTNEDDTSKILKESLPYSLYVDNDEYPLTTGLRSSVCGLVNQVQISANRDGDIKNNHIAQTTLTTRGPGNLPKQQFFLEGLNSSSSYSGIMVRHANSSAHSKRGDQAGVAGGGGTIMKTTNFTTRSTQTCQLIHDLDFCNETQYTTPGDESRFKTDALSKLYDDYARKMYANFETVMMQINCEVGSTSRYSLARDCDDCKAAYKRWLCLVTIPRCEDYSYDNGYAIMRSAGAPFPNGTLLPKEERESLEKNKSNNQSRNSWIDQEIQPGPYKEILPCEDICYEVVQSCPASIGFTCPQPRMTGFDVSYGRRHPNSTTSCNYPGEARTSISKAGAASPRMVLLGSVCLLAVGSLL